MGYRRDGAIADASQLAFVANEAGVSKLYMLNTKELSYQTIRDVPKVCCRW